MRKRIAGLLPSLVLAIGTAVTQAHAYELTEDYGFALTDLDADEVCAANEVSFYLKDATLGVVHFYEVCNAFLVVHDDRVFEMGWPEWLALRRSLEQVEAIAECASDEGWRVHLLREPDGNMVEMHTPCWRDY
jgi:hypothetical protein